MILEADNKATGNQIDRILIEKLLKKKLDDDDKKLIKKHSAEFHKALDNVKICDPAIGSGAFPMGLLHEIFTAKQTLHTFEHVNTKTFDASGVKLNIIQNSIYGVDIEKGAVDIARLRFWLSLIEYLTTWFENKGYEVVGYIGFDKPDQPKLFSVNEGRKGQTILEADNKATVKQIDRILSGAST